VPGGKKGEKGSKAMAHSAGKDEEGRGRGRGKKFSILHSGKKRENQRSPFSWGRGRGNVEECGFR